MGLFATTIVFAQSTQLKIEPNTNFAKTGKLIYPDSEGIDIYPTFPGGQAAFIVFIKKNLKWPPGPKLEGKVVLEFAVERNGNLSGLKVKKSLSKEYDNEAICVVESAPHWMPGRKLTAQGSKQERYRMSLPIVFSLK